MDSFVVLTNRKRALIALIHSVVFLLIAFRAVAKPSVVVAIGSLHGSALRSSVIFIAIYVIVTTILLQLARISQRVERLYFGLCATSAGFGILRYWLGDPTIHVAVYVRVIALSLAVGVGTMIWLGYSEQKTAA